MLIKIFLLFLINFQLLNAQIMPNDANLCQSGIREDNTNYIHCARRGLTDVPLQYINKNILYDELVLSDNKIKQLDEASFQRIKVKKLYLNGNPITAIQNKTFQYIANYLDELWLDSDTMTTIPIAITHYLKNLQILRLKNFSLKKLGNNSFAKLQRLEVLSLEDCSIEFIDVQAFNGIKNTLKELYLDGNALNKIPINSIYDMKSLKLLSLSQNSIKALGRLSFIPDFDVSLNLFNNLNKLDLSYNGISAIEQNTFSFGFSKLNSLLLQNNEINDLNLNNLLNNQYLQQLKELYLDFNVLNRLNKNLFLYKNGLETLSLQGNSIVFDDQSNGEEFFNGLGNLISLNLARNNIRHLPDNLFKSTVALQSLNLDRNSIENYSFSTFNGLKLSLINISLQYTKFSSNNFVSLKNFQGLERVKLGFNEIQTINWSDLFGISPNLTHFDLQANQIGQIVVNAGVPFESLNSLVELDLSNNKLCTFDKGLFERMRGLKSLSLTQNPLYCDCNLIDLHDWVKRVYDRDFVQFLNWKCENFAQKRFIQINRNDLKCSGESKCLPQTTTATTTTTTKTQTSSTVSTKTQIINDFYLINYETNLYLKWQFEALPKTPFDGYRIFITDNEYKKNQTYIITDAKQTEYLIKDLDYDRNYIVCLSLVKSYNKFCKAYILVQPPPRQDILMTNDTIVHNAHQMQNTGASSSSVNSILLTIIISIFISFLLFFILFIYVFMYKCKQTGCVNNSTLTSTTNTSTVSSTLSSLNKNTQAVKAVPVLHTTTTMPHDFYNTLHHMPQTFMVNGGGFIGGDDQHVYCEIPNYYYGYHLFNPTQTQSQPIANPSFLVINPNSSASTASTTSLLHNQNQFQVSTTSII